MPYSNLQRHLMKSMFKASYSIKSTSTLFSFQFFGLANKISIVLTQKQCTKQCSFGHLNSKSNMSRDDIFCIVVVVVI